MSLELKQIRSLVFYCWILSAEIIKVGYISTCDCRSVGQPFNAWFFPAFQHWPYSSWFTFHGITWLSGPYSLLWWGLNYPAVYGYWTFFAYLLICDIAAFYVLAQRSRAYALYWLTLSVWFVTVDPVDFFVVLFAVYGRFRAVWLVLAPLTKLPVGAPVWVWTWVFTNADSVKGPENYGRYLILGSVCLVSLILYTASRFHPVHNSPTSSSPGSPSDSLEESPIKQRLKPVRLGRMK